jgi:hypothetical protein
MTHDGDTNSMTDMDITRDGTRNLGSLGWVCMGERSDFEVHAPDSSLTHAKVVAFMGVWYVDAGSRHRPPEMHLLLEFDPQGRLVRALGKLSAGHWHDITSLDHLPTTDELLSYLIYLEGD